VIVLDTSAILALLDVDDPDHARSADALRGEAPPFVVPAGILGEVGYLIEAKLGVAAVVDFTRDLALRTLSLDRGEDDFARIAELVDRYAELRLGFADASVIACAERSGRRVLTLDFRDFVPVAREGRIELVLSA
jgi:predicted nucleic acid-binding protein